jgi:hypothetical protein
MDMVIDTGVLSPCLDCGSEDIEVTAEPIPGRRLALVECRRCGTSVIGDTAERAFWIWNLPRSSLGVTSVQAAPRASVSRDLRRTDT